MIQFVQPPARFSAKKPRLSSVLTLSAESGQRDHVQRLFFERPKDGEFQSTADTRPNHSSFSVNRIALKVS